MEIFFSYNSLWIFLQQFLWPFQHWNISLLYLNNFPLVQSAKSISRLIVLLAFLVEYYYIQLFRLDYFLKAFLSYKKKSFVAELYLHGSKNIKYPLQRFQHNKCFCVCSIECYCILWFHAIKTQNNKFIYTRNSNLCNNQTFIQCLFWYNIVFDCVSITKFLNRHSFLVHSAS